MKNFHVFLLQLFVIVSMSTLAYIRTDGFSTDKIYVNDEISSKFENCIDDVDKVLNQKFTYLAKGRQCFVFASEDQKYVIKFLNRYRVYRPHYFTFIPLPSFFEKYRDRKIAKIKKRFAYEFNSYRLAYDELKDESALLYVHLNKTSYLNKKMKLVNKAGSVLEVDLDDVCFIVQKKVKPIFEALEEFKNENKLQKGLDAFLDVIVSRCKKHIVDNELNVGINFGFFNDQAVILDIGRFSKKTELQNPQIFEKELLKSTKLFRKWLKDKYPDEGALFEKKIQESVQAFDQR